MSQLEETKQAVKYLKAARKLITPEGSWCKGYYARDAEGQPVYSYDEAHSFCSMGAVEASLGIQQGGFDVFQWSFLRDAFDGNIGLRNDRPSTKHLHVLMAYDFAILNAEDEVKRLKKLEKTQ